MSSRICNKCCFSIVSCCINVLPGCLFSSILISSMHWFMPCEQFIGEYEKNIDVKDDQLEIKKQTENVMVNKFLLQSYDPYEVAEWIINLKPFQAKMIDENRIIDEIIEQNITGETLISMDVEDIKLIGINNRQYIDIILQRIQPFKRDCLIVKKPVEYEEKQQEQKKTPIRKLKCKIVEHPFITKKYDINKLVEYIMELQELKKYKLQLKRIESL
eukprot:248777_1